MRLEDNDTKGRERSGSKDRIKVLNSGVPKHSALALRVSTVFKVSSVVQARIESGGNTIRTNERVVRY